MYLGFLAPSQTYLQQRSPSLVLTTSYSLSVPEFGHLWNAFPKLFEPPARNQQYPFDVEFDKQDV